MTEEIIKEEFDKAFKNNFPDAIIIDGVNVAGCNNFYKEWDSWSGKDNYRCQDNCSGMCVGDICYYKQLKQAENTVNECHKYLAELEDKIERLEQENKVLKDNINHLQAIIDDGRAENKRFREENIEYDEELAIEKLSHKSDLETLEQYRSALEEIREMCNRHLDAKEICYATQVIDKIDEVLNLS